MSCPFFVDSTRMCVVRFPDIVKFTAFETCQSEQYIDCPIYLPFNNSFNCEHLNYCIKQRLEETPQYVQNLFMGGEAHRLVKDIQIKYCFSPQNSKTCMRYSLFLKGEIPSSNLMPDGRKINLLDLIKRRKLIIQPPE